MEEKLNTLLVQGIQNEEGKSRELPADRWNELAEAKDSKEKNKYLYSLKHKFAQILLAPYTYGKLVGVFVIQKKTFSGTSQQNSPAFSKTTEVAEEWKKTTKTPDYMWRHPSFLKARIPMLR